MSHVSNFLDRVGSTYDEDMKQSLQRCLAKSTESEKFTKWMCSEEPKTFARLLTMCFFVNRGIVMVNTCQEENSNDFDEGELISGRVLISEEILESENALIEGLVEGPTLNEEVPLAVELATSFLNEVDKCMELESAKGRKESDLECKSSREGEDEEEDDANFLDGIELEEGLTPAEKNSIDLDGEQSQFEQELEALTLS